MSIPKDSKEATLRYLAVPLLNDHNTSGKERVYDAIHFLAMAYYTENGNLALVSVGPGPHYADDLTVNIVKHKDDGFHLTREAVAIIHPSQWNDIWRDGVLRVHGNEGGIRTILTLVPAAHTCGAVISFGNGMSDYFHCAREPNHKGDHE